MLDRLMHHGYGVQHAVPGREGGDGDGDGDGDGYGVQHAVPGREGAEVEHQWGCGLSLDRMDCWQCWGGVGWMRRVLEIKLRLGLGLGLGGGLTSYDTLHCPFSIPWLMQKVHIGGAVRGSLPPQNGIPQQ